MHLALTWDCPTIFVDAAVDRGIGAMLKRAETGTENRECSHLCLEAVPALRVDEEDAEGAGVEPERWQDLVVVVLLVRGLQIVPLDDARPVAEKAEKADFFLPVQWPRHRPELVARRHQPRHACTAGRSSRTRCR